MFAFFSPIQPLSPAQNARLARVERKLDLILEHLGIDYDDAKSPSTLAEEVRRLADDGRKIEAIKAHRELTGAGLRDAKDAVEAYLRGH